MPTSRRSGWPTSRPEKSIQLTRGKKSSSNPTWSPDGRWIAFTSGRIDDKSQLFAIRPDGGEAVQLTKFETGVGGFDWSPDGRTIAFTAGDPVTDESKARKDFYGDYAVVRGEYTHSHLWTVDVAEALRAPQPGKRRTVGKAYTVGGFEWSPDGKKIAFSATVDPDLVNGGTSDIYVLDLAGDSVKKIVDQPGPDSSPLWSPDGGSILFSSALGRPDYYARNSVLAVVAAAGGAAKPLTSAFDENPYAVAWNADGIYFSAMQKTAGHLFRLDPATLAIERLSGPDEAMVSGFTFSADGRRVTFQSATATALPEICVSEWPWKPRPLTRMTDQVAGFVLGTRELVSWKSKDGTTIEGVLIKPADFDPARKYALLCVIHGGPTGVDRPNAPRRATRAITPRTSGPPGAPSSSRSTTGAARATAKSSACSTSATSGWATPGTFCRESSIWSRRGWVDPGRVGCMGWSQGGYISAFLTTSSRAFKAISVGAGISNWATYYYNTDITPFTINYLGDDPADDPAIYAKTSPMTYIKKGGDADPDPARRVRPARAHPQRLRAAPGTGRPGRAGRDGRLQGLRPRHHQAEVDAGGHGAQPGLVRPLHLRRCETGPERTTASQEGRRKSEIETKIIEGATRCCARPRGRREPKGGTRSSQPPIFHLALRRPGH